MTLRVQRLCYASKLPKKATKLSAGYDLSSVQQVTLPAWSTTLVKTGIAIAVPGGFYGRIAPRSGLALKHSIDVGAGVIDPDYRGEVGVILFNHSDTEFKVNVGDRIAQLIIEHIGNPEIEQVILLDETERAAAGYGSTGISLT